MSGYEDILQLPHHRSAKRAHMAQQDRAAQFAPFAALSGHEGEIAEAARLTEGAVDLSDWAVEQVDRGLQTVRQRLDTQPEITLTYFVPDQRKSGGAYHTVTARVRKILELEQALLLSDETLVPFRQIIWMRVG